LVFQFWGTHTQKAPWTIQSNSPTGDQWPESLQVLEVCNVSGGCGGKTVVSGLHDQNNVEYHEWMERDGITRNIRAAA